ncbi:hypothetical protein CEUSTIGMA_g10781.t1 [Chlamydomonas eustigma]|uniref:Uncharacterized protein n=1 Tax=Chlamydomonas eustigma TaxID=1157962 RepID=A0A250XK12_9CHLO|nr:hypothetical protein CEUSTIGMA_g10781.t1 [Chlamydomonas eustigma]|eukprot:GAX83356.1 hypothetical protein CEUSTIGMA_g10781.t1 [Chlamydomonas eustigma]
MLQILQFHPRREEKIGPGIKCLTVTQTEAGRYAKQTRCFAIIRADGIQEDFSYIKCLMAIFSNSTCSSPCRSSEKTYVPFTLNQGSSKYGVLKALRSCVKSQLLFFKERQLEEAKALGFPLTCPINGTPLTSANSIVDYIPPDTFKNLTVEWLALEGLKISDIRVQTIQNYDRYPLLDPDLSSKWQDFHEHNASLRLASKKGVQDRAALNRPLRNSLREGHF